MDIVDKNQAYVEHVTAQELSVTLQCKQSRVNLVFFFSVNLVFSSCDYNFNSTLFYPLIVYCFPLLQHITICHSSTLPPSPSALIHLLTHLSCHSPLPPSVSPSLISL